MQKLISRNDKIYSRGQKYIINHPKDLNLIQISPSTDLNCGVISSNTEHIQADYRYRLELGLDSLPKLRDFSKS